MAVGKRDLHVTAPSKPPVAEHHPKELHSGQEGVHYGFRHELHIKDPNKSELSHHFHDSKPGREEPQEPPSHKMHRAGRPGAEKHDDEPG